MDAVWGDARSIADLGRAMADWLEGRIDSWPGYAPGCGPDAETTHLVPTLAALNRAGFVTTCSQPGIDDVAFDGRPWVQRAAVQGYLAAGDPLLGRIVRAGQAAGLVVTAYGSGTSVGPRRGLLATVWGGEPHTGFGGRAGPLQRLSEWPGVGRPARRQLRREGVAVAVIDPVWGRDDLLWPTLAGALAGRADRNCRTTAADRGGSHGCPDAAAPLGSLSTSTRRGPRSRRGNRAKISDPFSRPTSATAAGGTRSTG